MKKNILIFGIGYVGFSLAVMLARKNNINIIDTDIKKVDQVNKNISPIVDQDISRFLKFEKLNLSAHTKIHEDIGEVDFAIIAVPTNYDEKTDSFDTSIVESVIEYVLDKIPNAYIVVKSTIPIGFIDSMRSKYNNNNIVFSPEFLREGSALHDNLYPSRIIIGDTSNKAISFCEMMSLSSKNKHNKIIYTSTNEAESIKLFANTYLAMRVAFFNELDTFAVTKDLNTKEIIDGVCSDPRIGNDYNNPSFGYGGYCLPKDTKQLQSNFKSIPQALITATILSNDIRKSFIAEQVIKMNVKTVGIYRLAMKFGSDNSRSSSIFNIIEDLISKNIDVIVYEPNHESNKNNDMSFNITNDLESFKKLAGVILANRFYDELYDVQDKIFTRDIFNTN